jgi:hypothetical protein
VVKVFDLLADSEALHSMLQGYSTVTDFAKFLG